MNTLTKIIIEEGLSNRIINASQLKRLVKGSEQRRYNLVNRAIKSGELQRFQRGLYMLNERFRDFPCHPFVFAQVLFPGSYISFETALAYHGWIPEAVFITSSVAPGRKSRTFDQGTMGGLSFHPLSIQSGFFLELVNTESTKNQRFLLANPFRALMDLVCLRKLKWDGIDFLSDSLRIDQESIDSITSNDIKILERIYKNNRVKSYLACLSKELNLD